MDEQTTVQQIQHLVENGDYEHGYANPLDAIAYLLSALGTLQDAHEVQRLHLASALERMNAAEAERDEARANNNRSICVFCGTITPFPLDATQEQRVLAMWTHAEGCKERPEKRLAAEVERLTAALVQIREALELIENCDGWNPCVLCRRKLDELHEALASACPAEREGER